jgi:hypothetical protein
MSEEHRRYADQLPPRYHATQGGSRGQVSQEQFLDAVGDLNIARKTRLIYPADHHSVQSSIRKAHKTIQSIVTRTGQLTLTTSREAQGDGSQTVEQPRQKIQMEMIQALKQLAIAVLTFEPGVSINEVAHLMEVMIRDPQDIFNEGGIDAWIKPPDFLHIKVFSLDYSRLQLTDEAEIGLSDDASGATVWDRFVNYLVGDKRDEKDGSAPEALDPVVLAGRMNQKELDTGKAVSGYSQLLDNLSKAVESEEEGAEADEDDSLGYFRDLMQELDPSLRQQFLSVTFAHCMADGNEGHVTRLMDGLGKEMVIQMLRFAKTDGKKISPSLLALIQKIGFLPQSVPQHGDVGAAKGDSPSKDMRNLLQQEGYESFVDKEYDALLKGLADQTHAIEPIEALSADLVQGLDKTGVDCHIGKALTRLMIISGDTQGYRDWARQLALTLDDLVDDGALESLTEILAFVLNEDERQQDPEKKRIAGLVRNRFSDPQFVANVIESIGYEGGPPSSEVKLLLKHMGEVALIEILDAIDPTAPADHIQNKLLLLEPFGSLAAAEALHRLNDPRPAYLQIMVMVVRRFGNADLVDGVRHLLNHDDLDLRLAALTVLLEHQNGWGLARLRDLLNSGWSREMELALELAARHKFSEAVPLLAASLQSRMALSSELEHCQMLMEVMGRIGDPASLPVLTKLARKRWTLSPKRLRQLKYSLFDSLGGYPYASVADMIHSGIKHRDKEIQSRCQALLKAFHQKPASQSGHSEQTRSS